MCVAKPTFLVQWNTFAALKIEFCVVRNLIVRVSKVLLFVCPGLFSQFIPRAIANENNHILLKRKKQYWQLLAKYCKLLLLLKSLLVVLCIKQKQNIKRQLI